MSKAVKEAVERDVGKDLVSAMVNLSRGEIERLDGLSRDEFLRKTNAHEHVLDEEAFRSLKKAAHERLISLGLANPKEMAFGPGTYLIVGDSHGKHTRTKMFDLLKNLQAQFGFDKVVHVGHALDDDNVISYWWKDFPNLVVLSKQEELAVVEQHRREWGNFAISRESVRLGNLLVRNQDLITDYVKTSIKGLDQHIFDAPQLSTVTGTNGSAAARSGVRCSPCPLGACANRTSSRPSSKSTSLPATRCAKPARKASSSTGACATCTGSGNRAC